MAQKMQKSKQLRQDRNPAAECLAEWVEDPVAVECQI
jgi:hypothetical protein